MAKRRTKAQIESDARVSQVAAAVRNVVAAMKITESQAAQVFGALYRDVVSEMLTSNNEALSTEVSATVENRMTEAFDQIVHDVDQLTKPTLQPGTFVVTSESEEKVFQ